MAVLALGRRAGHLRSRLRRPPAASRRSHSSWPRGGRGSWPSSGRSRHRPRRARSSSSARSRSGTASRPRPRSAGCSTWGWGRCSRRGSTGSLPRYRSTSRSSPASCSPRSCSSAAGRGAGRATSARSSSTPVCCSPFSAIVSAVHVPGGTFIHSAIALAPFSYILALEGIDVAVQLGRQAAILVGRRQGEPDLHRRRRRVRARLRRRGFSRGPRRLGGSSPTAGGRGDDADPGRRRRRVPGHVDRRLLDEVLDEPRRGRPRQRSDRHDRGGRTSIRDRVARPGCTGVGTGRCTDPRREPAVLGRAAAEHRDRRADGLPAGARLDDSTRGDPDRPRTVRRGAGDANRRRLGQSSSRSPRTRPTTSVSRATSSKAAASSRMRCGASQPRRWSFPHPAFEVWLPLPTFLAAIPMAFLGATFQAAQVSSVARRGHRAGPRLAARSGYRGRTWTAARQGADGRRRCRADDRGLPAASAQLGPPGLHDAVHGDRPGRVPADDPDRRAIRAAAVSPTRG